jgi:hypothetical protein
MATTTLPRPIVGTCAWHGRDIAASTRWLRDDIDQAA